MSGAVDSAYPRWAAFFDATLLGANGKEHRAEWFVASPSRLAHGAPLASLEGKARYIKRQRDAPNAKWTWKTVTKQDGDLLTRTLEGELQTFEDLGWQFRAPVVIPLDEDDYVLMYVSNGSASTPYKALRHVEKWTKKRGYEIK